MRSVLFRNKFTMQRIITQGDVRLDGTKLSDVKRIKYWINISIKVMSLIVYLVSSLLFIISEIKMKWRGGCQICDPPILKF